MKLFKALLLVLAVAMLAAAAGNLKPSAGPDSAEIAPGISFSLRILGRELLGFSFRDSRSTPTSWINEHEKK